MQSKKRVTDVILAGVGLLVTWPAMFVLAALVRLKLGRPILFRQVRPGLHGRPFVLYKFRTMADERSADGTPLPDEKRLTRLGEFLRSTSLDELPELWNVVWGDMSLVGPRPLRMDYLPLYSRQQFRRHEVPPGITGWAQVNGRNACEWPERLRLDVWYVDHQNLRLDLKILGLTVWKVISRTGINKSEHVTMPPFRGEQ